MATSSTITTYKNFIGGQWVDSRSSKFIENRNPANTDEVVGIFPASNQEDVNDAVAAATAAYEGWRATGKWTASGRHVEVANG